MGLKKLLEQREAKQKEMKQLLEVAETEERALQKEETEKFDKLEAEIRAIDASIQAIYKQRELEEDAPKEKEEKKEEETQEERDYKDFDAFIRNEVETRDATTLNKGDNGAIIPSTIANKIIDKVVDMCPIYHDAERYNVKGTLTIPYYDETSGKIAMDYAEEGTDGESGSGSFKNISLTGFLARAITEISKSLINNSQFDVTNFIINKMAQAIAVFLEKEAIHGTDNKIDGLKGITQIVTAAAATAVTADEIIDLQEAIPDQYQANAYFIMNKKTRTAIRKLKDGQGNYLLNKDATSRWGYTLFGKDVYTSAQVDEMAAGKTAIYYGDMKGLAVKVSEDINIEVLRETKARQHMIEVVGFVECDAKVQNAEMIACLKMKA
ncbi:MAG: phage major capsid protein [Clostridiales bacterium]|nr:phage major capsid protein [Clostridiales bacterium]